MARWPAASSSISTGRLLDAEGIVSATNSLGLERLAGISPAVPQHAHRLGQLSRPTRSLLPDKQRGQAESLYEPTAPATSSPGGHAVAEPGRIRDGSPRNFSIVKRAITTGIRCSTWSTPDGAGRTQRELVAPAKIFVDEGVYYAAVCTDVGPTPRPADKKALRLQRRIRPSTRRTGKPRIWQVLRIWPASSRRSWSKPTEADRHPGRAREPNCASGVSTTAPPAVFITDQRRPGVHR